MTDETAVFDKISDGTEAYQNGGKILRFSCHDKIGRNSSWRTVADDQTDDQTPKTVPEYGEKATFGTSFGMFVTCVGCVLGTGNMWRFSRVTASSSSPEGSFSFIIAWMVSLFVWSLPLLITEYTLGRYCRAAPLMVFYKFFGIKLMWIGGWIVAVTYMITAYFSVIVGWCLYYVYKACTLTELPSDEFTSEAIFYAFARDSYWPVFTHFLSVAFVGACIVGGIRWIERANMVLVPMLLFILLFTFAWSLTREYADVGIVFIFTPVWKDLLSPFVWVDALCQNAFDTGAAMALFISYSSFFTRKNAAVRPGTLLPIGNNCISFICALTIFGTVFSTLVQTTPTLTRSMILQIMKTNGPGSTGLTFIWIPVLYSHIGTFGRVLCVLYFLCLSFAGLTSLIGHIQLTVVTLQDLGLTGRKSSFGGLLLTFLFGLPSALSIDVLTNQDTVWGYSLMLSGTALACLVIVYGPLRYRRVIVNNFGITDWKLPLVWVASITVFVPATALFLLVWWLYQSITNVPTWYHITLDSVATTLLEWSVILLLLFIANAVVVCFKIDIFPKSRFVGYDPYHPDYIPTAELLSKDETSIFVSALSLPSAPIDQKCERNSDPEAGNAKPTSDHVLPPNGVNSR